MDSPSPAPAPDADAPDADEVPGRDNNDNSNNNNNSNTVPGTIVEISATGDVILDVVFETSRETLKAARKKNAAARPPPSSSSSTKQPGPATPPSSSSSSLLKPKVRVGYRVQSAELRRQSKYFANLLGDTRFQEARAVAAALAGLAARGVKPADAAAAELPRVRIVDDDESTRAAGRERRDVFADLLRVLHGGSFHLASAPGKMVTMGYIATMGVLADRFACTAPLARYLNGRLKFRWPVTPARRGEEGGGGVMSEAAEETLRQKILVAWLLDQPPKMQASTRELVMLGSRRWSAFLPEEDGDGDGGNSGAASWWDLQDGLERELQYRRECILNTVGSVQRHFFRLYASRERQCKLGYDSSASCDSYQLGEMVKFLCGRNLAWLVDFSPASLLAYDRDQEEALGGGGGGGGGGDIDQLIATLKQCPAYQIDKNHTNCGLRTKILPILDYIQTMLSSSVVSINRTAWKTDREAVSWVAAAEREEEEEEEKRFSSSFSASTGRRRKDDDDDGGGRRRVFRFTRSVASDQRLRYEGAMAADRMARELFTAKDWDWTPED